MTRSSATDNDIRLDKSPVEAPGGPAVAGPPAGPAAETFREVAHSVPKVDGEGLVCGQPMFCDDIDLRGMLIGKIMPSPHAHARIAHIDTAAAEALRGVKCVLTHKNVPRVAHTTAGQGYPEPLFDGEFDVLGSRCVGARHLKLELGQGPCRHDAIHFGGWDAQPLPARIRIAFRLAPDDWRGGDAVQLIIEHREAA